MSTESRAIRCVVWGGLAVVTAVIAVAYFRAEVVLTPHRPKERPLLVYGRLKGFELTNQLGRIVTLGDLRDHVWVADIIFTRCPGPCAQMSERMSRLQAALPPGRPVRLVSLTTDPEFDTPEVLARYAERYSARPERWHFLTGPKAEIARLAVEGLKLVLTEKDPDQREQPNDLFLHSTIFVLVDKQGRVRRTYEVLPRPDEEETPGQPNPAAAFSFDAVQREILDDIGRLLEED